MADIIKKINVRGTPYDIVDASAVHTVDSALSSTSENPVQNKVINTALGGKEDKTNKVTSLSSASTDTQYPSAKCTYDELQKRMFVYQLAASPTQTSASDVRILFTYQSTDMMAIASYWASYNEFAITTSTILNNKATQIIATKSRTAEIDGVNYYLFNGVLSNGKDDTQTLPFVIAFGVNSTSGILYFNYYANAVHSHGLISYTGRIDSSEPVSIPVLNDNDTYEYGILVNDQGNDGIVEPSAITFGRDNKNLFLSRDGTWSQPTEGHFNVVGSGSTAAKTTSPYCAAIWKGSNSDINALYDGLSINYTLDVTGNATYGTVLDLNDLGNHPVLTDAGAAIADTYAANACIQLVYDEDATASVYINSASASTITGCWKLAIAQSPPYYVQGVGSTAASSTYSARWRGSNSAIKGLYSGLAISYKLDIAGSSDYAVMLDLNGWGWHPVVRNVNTNISTAYEVGCIVNLIYDATQTASVRIGSTTAVSRRGCWKIADYNSNTNTIGYQLRTNSYSMPMQSITYRYRLLFTSADNKHWVPANNSSSTDAAASKTVCQNPINPFGEIVYYGTTASVAAGSRPSATVLWQEYTISLGYSFNRTGSALTLTSWKPVYVKCTPQEDGSAIIDANIPYVQELPTEEDNCIYIELGVAYSATNIELLMNHPVYYYKDGAIRPWTFSAAVDVPTVGTLNTTIESSLPPSASESFGGSISLHKVSKTGKYEDLSTKNHGVHLYKGTILANSSTPISGSNLAEYELSPINPAPDLFVNDTILDNEGKYGRVTSWDTSTHTGTAIYAGDYLDLKYTNLNPTTIALGGIPAGTTFDNVSIRTIIENLLYPYVAFTFSSIATTVASGTFEYGTAKSITKVTPTFTNGSRSINSVKIGNTSGGSNLYSGSSATSGTAITLTSSASLDGKSNYTVYCTLSDGTTTTTKSASFNFEKYIYYGSKSATGGTPSSNELTGVRPSVASGNSGVSITTTDNSYVWFVCPDTTRTHLQQFSSNEWVTIDTTSVGAISFLTNTGQSLTYYAYRSNTFVAGTNTFRITT